MEATSLLSTPSSRSLAFQTLILKPSSPLIFPKPKLVSVKPPGFPPAEPPLQLLEGGDRRDR
ncbi:hypothetical protein SLEP1_g5607 [Rubroshorea leprosula]|uniref:Uncharacterized protein n=1 Tax=Rubroshorea leprosula TaxID=152421 RepID=A0AAV5I1G8_9ROSI|nr:hypothetical protein SLEP1_g5607 [Rubroshorea leprosula]